MGAGTALLQELLKGVICTLGECIFPEYSTLGQTQRPPTRLHLIQVLPSPHIATLGVQHQLKTHRRTNSTQTIADSISVPMDSVS